MRTTKGQSPVSPLYRCPWLLTMENQMVPPFRKHQKLWAVIWGNAVFLLFLACSADLDILCSGLFYHHVKFDSFIFMHKIFTRVVCVNGKHPISPSGHFHITGSSLSAENLHAVLPLEYRHLF